MSNLIKEDELDFIYASGNCICEICGKTYLKHPFDYSILGMEDHAGIKQPFLNILCDGTKVKL